jgi:hypothetical protein
MLYILFCTVIETFIAGSCAVQFANTDLKKLILEKSFKSLKACP